MQFEESEWRLLHDVIGGILQGLPTTTVDERTPQ
jgi:hypothetical protein